MDKTYRAVYRDLSQLVLGELVDETETHIVLRDAVLLAFGGGGDGQVAVQFLPVDLLSMQPPVTIRNFTEDPHFDSRYAKCSLLNLDVEINTSILDNYEKFLNPSKIVTPTNADVPAIKLFD